MPTPSVHEAVEKLNAALADANALTPEDRAELERVLGDARRALGHEKSLANRAGELTARFETEHPHLAEAIAALARALAGVGI